MIPEHKPDSRKEILASPEQTDNDAGSLLEQAIARSKLGDVLAFRRLVELHQQYAFSLAFRIVCDEDDARDIAQETFIRVWQHIKDFVPEVKFTTWLYRIVVNLSYDRLKGRGRRRRLFVTMSETTGFDHEEGVLAVDAHIENRDLSDKIKAIARGLPRKQRMVFVLRDLQDMTVEETAEILKMSHESVKTNLCYARRHIRLRLKQTEV